MYSPLIVDRTEPKWLLLEQIFKFLSARRSHQELSKWGDHPGSGGGDRPQDPPSLDVLLRRYRLRDKGTGVAEETTPVHRDIRCSDY